MNRLENDKYMDKHDKAQQKILEADERKQELVHYDNVSGRGVIVYLLKGYTNSDKPHWDEEFNECQNPDQKYADGSYEFPAVGLGVYSKGEWREAEAHGKRYTERTGLRYAIVETPLEI